MAIRLSMLPLDVKRIANTQSNVSTSNPNLILQVEGFLNMFDCKVSAHTHYDDACKKFALAQNMKDVAKQAGMRAQTQSRPAASAHGPRSVNACRARFHVKAIDPDKGRATG